MLNRNTGIVPAFERLMPQSLGGRLLHILGLEPRMVRVEQSVSIEVHTVQDLLSGTAQLINVGMPLTARVTLNSYNDNVSFTWKTERKVTDGN